MARKFKTAAATATSQDGGYKVRPYPGRLSYIFSNESDHGRLLRFKALLGSRRIPEWIVEWSRVERSDIHVIPGEHDTLLKEPYVAKFAEAINACMDRGHA